MKKKYDSPYALLPNGLEDKLRNAKRCDDWRLFDKGWKIPTRSYADQPYLLKTDDGALLCVVTTGSGQEGTSGQHVTVMRSMDKGETWSEPVAVESPSNPESSYAVLLKVPSGRIYCFYNYNEDNIREMETVFPGNPLIFRVDTLGYHVFKYSDDHGKTWSEKYYKIPIRMTDIDRKNIRKGEVRFMWNVGRPFVLNGAAYTSIHKVGNLGEGFIVSSEGWLVRSDNILTESDPEEIRWETLPDGEIGLCTPAGGGLIAEEQSYSVLSDGTIYCVYRSTDGWLVECYSRDGGHNWSEPQYKCYASGHRMKNPRAAAFTWKCQNGKYLQWFHNHGGRFIGSHGLDEPEESPYDNRNPVWVAPGVEKDSPAGKILEWGPPEILLYHDDPFIRMSYPDLIELDEEMYIAETQKSVARLHRIDPLFLERLWGQFDEKTVDESACILSLEEGMGEVGRPVLPDFFIRDIHAPDHRGVDLRQGFSFCFRIVVPENGAAEVLLDNRTDSGRGWMIRTTNRGGLELIMSDGQTTALNTSESGLLCSGEERDIAIIVDGGPKVVSFVVDGLFCDGGEERQFGWSRFSPLLCNAVGSSKLFISENVKRLKVFSRALMSCEVAAIQSRKNNLPTGTVKKNYEKR